MAVRIRMKKLGRRHRPFFRICAMDSRSPRDGRALEELGTYDPMLSDVDARTVLKADRIDYWLSVGAQPSKNVNALIKKYGTNGTHLEQQKAAREQLSLPKTVPDAPEPVVIPVAEEPAAEAEAVAAPEAETVAETPAGQAPVAEAAEATPEAAPEPPAEEKSE